MEPLYLKSSVAAEPLFNEWYAWALLIYPPTAALITKNLHLRVLDSYRQFPDMHAEAARSQALLGGMFVDAEVAPRKARELFEHTVSELAGLVDLAAAIGALNELLQKNAVGFSLEELYSRIPAPLSGYVELVYDLDNRPSVRFLERLFYKGAHYHEGRQSLLLCERNEDTRPFFLSTPRFEQAGDVRVARPFACKALDQLFDSRRRPLSRARVTMLAEELRIAAAQFEQFGSLFDTTPPAALRPHERHETGGVRIRYFGHATLLIESGYTTLLTDPLISYGSQPAAVRERFSFADLPERIDYVAITHAHQDHVVLETLLQIRARTDRVLVPKNVSGCLQDPALKGILQMSGFPHVTELAELDELAVPGGRIVGIPFLGEHGDLNIGSKIAYFIEFDGIRILCLADANNLQPAIYEHIKSHVGAVDAMFIGMECVGAPLSWLYGPLLTKPISYKMDRSRRLNASNCDRALELVRIFEPRAVFVYAMALEPWLRHISSVVYTPDAAPLLESERLVQTCRQMGLTAARLQGMQEILITATDVELR